MTFLEILQGADYFEGEYEAIEEEFCGPWRVAFVQLPPQKRERLGAWLGFPKEARQKAFEVCRERAVYPIAQALDMLKHPEKYKPRAAAKTADAISAWLEAEES